MIVVEDVHKHFGGFRAVDGASLEIQKGSITGLIGPNGAGKTTLMKLLSFEQKPSTGEVILEGFSSDRIRRRELPLIRRRIGPVFQDFRLLRDRTAYENIAIVLRATGARRRSDRRRDRSPTFGGDQHTLRSIGPRRPAA